MTLLNHTYVNERNRLTKTCLSWAVNSWYACNSSSSSTSPSNSHWKGSQKNSKIIQYSSKRLLRFWSTINFSRDQETCPFRIQGDTTPIPLHRHWQWERPIEPLSLADNKWLRSPWVFVARLLKENLECITLCLIKSHVVWPHINNFLSLDDGMKK